MGDYWRGGEENEWILGILDGIVDSYGNWLELVGEWKVWDKDVVKVLVWVFGEMNSVIYWDMFWWLSEWLLFL